MKRGSRRIISCLVFVLAVIASVWLYAAEWADDDRPPIIVQGGSLKIQGGDPRSANPKECCNNWKKDWLSDEWKPDPDNKDGVREFAVTVTGVPSSVCAMSDVRGQQVFVYFQYGTERARDYSLYRIQIEARNGFGQREPKIVPPRLLAANNSASPKTPGTLEDDRHGFISGVRVGSASCGFDETNKDTLAIRIQPKTDRQLR